MTRRKSLAGALSSSALRLSIAFIGLFVAGALLYVALVHYAVQRTARDQLEAAIGADVKLGRDVEAREGADALARRFAQTPQTLFAIVDAHGKRVAGSLPDSAEKVGRRVVTIPWDGSTEDRGEPIDLLVQGVRLDDGAMLVVGRSLFASGELVEWLDETAAWTALGIVALALGGGLLVATAFLRRLDRVSAAIDRIMAGAYAERLPSIGMGREFDRLAAQLNALLDRIIALMEGHRQLSANIAHDLRTPLGRVKRRLEQARGDLPPAEAATVDDALGEIDGLLATFAALLQLGTIEAGALRGRFCAVDLSEVLSSLEAAFAPVAEDQGKAFVLDAPRPVRVAGDSALLAQLFTNLIENALIHGGARIALRIVRHEGDVVARVSDDGCGIPMAERTTVIDRFTRLERSRTAPGSGLGLALVAAIATLHGGTLTLEDNDPGLRVVVRFPALA